MKRMFHRIQYAVGKYLLDRKNYRFFIKNWIELKDLSLCAEVIKTMRFSANLQPILRDIPGGKNILAIAPHPDDEILGPGGTLIKSIRNGARVTCFYLTNGRASDEMEMIKQSSSVAKRIGYEVYRFGYHSGRIPMNERIIGELARRIEEIHPDTIFLPIFLDDHDDHRRASHLVFETYSKDFIQNMDSEIWAYGVYTPNWPNVMVDITDTVEEKRYAINMFKNQTKRFDWAHMAIGLNAFNTRFHKKPNSENYIETFFVVPFFDYMELCRHYFSPDSSRIYYSPHYAAQGYNTQ